MAELLEYPDGIIAFEIRINGSKMADTIEVQEIEVEMEVNRISAATLIVQEGRPEDTSKADFSNSESKDFVPGSEIEVSLGYANEREKVFKGVVVSQQLRMNNNAPQLIIHCQDKAVQMTKGRQNAIFQNKTDAAALKSIASNYSIPFDMDDTPISHPVLTQYNCSDWDFMVMRAEANNKLVHSHLDKINVKKIDYNQAPQFEIRYGVNIIDIDLSLQSENQYAAYSMAAWDPTTQEMLSSSIPAHDELKQGNINAKDLVAQGTGSSAMHSAASITEAEMKTYCEAQAERAALEKIQGKITVPGTASIVAGNFIELSGFSQRFNGKAYVSKVSHIVKEGDWQTELFVGKSATPHAALPGIEAVGASGLVPPVRGTQIAIVKSIVEDPINDYRILVSLPTLKGTAQEDGIWARMAIPYASAEAGFSFFPELGDEVLLTFMNDDPRFPVIIGSLYSAKHKPKVAPDEYNRFKSIYSKSGIHITFDDQDKVLAIETPGQQTVVLDDTNNSIQIKDANDNAIIMDASGITLNSPKDITLSAGGSINLDASTNLAMEAKADITVAGSNITQSAEVAFTAKGNATAELAASGQTTVKGAMVMIN